MLAFTSPTTTTDSTAEKSNAKKQNASHYPRTNLLAMQLKHIQSIADPSKKNQTQECLLASCIYRLINYSSSGNQNA
jgi:hypothetical protein